MALGGSGGGSASGVRAGKAFVEVSGRDIGLSRALNQAQARLRSFVASVRSVGERAFGAGGLLTLGGGGPLGLFGALGLDKLQELGKQGAIADAFGLTAQRFTGIAGVAKSAGEDVREFTESLVTLGKVASEGAAGKGEVAPQFFEDIKVNAAEFAKLPIDEQFFKLFEALEKVEDPLTRVRSLMTAFGEDGGKYLLPLLGKAPSEIREMAAAFAASDRDIASATAAQQAYAQAAAAIDRVWRQVVVAVAPAVEQIANLVTKAAGPVSQFIEQNRELIPIAVGLAGSVAAAGAALAGFGLVMSGAATAAGPLLGALAVTKGLLIAGVAVAAKAAAAALALVMNPITHILAAVGGLGYVFGQTTNIGQEMSDRLGAAVGGLSTYAVSKLGELADGVATRFGQSRDTVLSAWESIRSALRGNDFKTAAEIGMDALGVEWARIVADMTTLWNGFMGTVGEWWFKTQDAAALAWESIKAGGKTIADIYQQAMSNADGVFKPLAKFWEATVNFMADTFGGFLGWVGAKIAELFRFLSENAGGALALAFPGAVAAFAAAADQADKLGEKVGKFANDVKASYDAHLEQARTDLLAAQEAARKAREEGRKIDADNAAAAVKAAEQRLKDAQAREAAAAAEREAIDLAQRAAEAAAAALPRAGAAAAVAAGANMIRVGYSAPDWQQFLNSGGSDIPKQQLKEQKKLNKGIAGVQAAVEAIDVPGMRYT